MDSENWYKLSLIVATCAWDNLWISFALWVKDNYFSSTARSGDWLYFMITLSSAFIESAMLKLLGFLRLIGEMCLNIWQAKLRDEMPNRCSWLQLPLPYSIYLCFPYMYPLKIEMMLRTWQSNSWIHSATGQWLHFTQKLLNASCHSWLISSLLQFHSLKLFKYFQSPLFLNSSLLKLSSPKK